MLARLTDYFLTQGIPWTRRLWDVGSILALEELWEACAWQSRKVLSPAAVDWHRRELSRLVGPDQGLGDQDLRREVGRLLNGVSIVDPSPAHRRLRHLIDHAQAGYLNRWASALRTGAAVKPERLARTLSAHLLDLGFAAPYLEQWVTGLRTARADTWGILESAAELAVKGESSYEVLVALMSVPQSSNPRQHTSWLTSTQVRNWLQGHGFQTTGVRINGGFVYTIPARDPIGAANKGRQFLERMIARSQFVRRDRGGISAHPEIWVAGHADPIPLRVPSRSADVLALSHLGQLFDVQAGSLIDDALELAAPINQGGPPGPAVAGAWAAVESLLSHPGDPTDDASRGGKAIAADRLASIIACSWPRAELTTLIHRHNGTEELVERREACETNHARAALLLDELKVNGVARLDFQRPTRHSDFAAADRMLTMASDPQQALRQVELAAQVALRRLYRARNVVLHGGSTSSVALEATLRTAAPLVGAGLDRITHHLFESGLQPLDLAARAELAIELVGGETGLTVVDLLQKPGSPPVLREEISSPPSNSIADYPSAALG